MTDDPTCEVCGQAVTDADPGEIVARLKAPDVTLATSFTPTVRQDVYRHNRCL